MPDAPRRVPTEVERAAAAVEAGHAWRHTANSRPGFATWPNTAPGSPSWWGRDFPAAEALRMFDPQTMSGTRYGEQMRAAFTDEQLADLDQRMVPRDPNRPPLHWRDITGLPEPRRRWWHRLTRRNP